MAILGLVGNEIGNEEEEGTAAPVAVVAPVKRADDAPPTDEKADDDAGAGTGTGAATAALLLDRARKSFLEAEFALIGNPTRFVSLPLSLTCLVAKWLQEKINDDIWRLSCEGRLAPKARRLCGGRLPHSITAP